MFKFCDIFVEIFCYTSRRGTFYQIVQKKVYRQKDCLFPSRCAGIEHFLLKLAPDLPDMDLVVNTRDYPQSSKYFGGPLPIFSFSKVSKILINNLSTIQFILCIYLKPLYFVNLFYVLIDDFECLKIYL